MAIITDAGKPFLVKVNLDVKNTISLGFNLDGTIRRYEDGKLIKEFSSINEYSEWVKINRPEEHCPDETHMKVKWIKEHTFASDQQVQEAGLFQGSKPMTLAEFERYVLERRA